MGKWTQLVNRSIAASLLIGLGDYALLKMGNPIGPVIFALGLLGVCYMGLNLFTGKCGFLFEDRIPPAELGMILLVNLVSGYVIGLIFSLADPAVAEAAVLKAQGWEMSLAFFIRSVLCGVVMYVAVLMYRKKTPLGILFGIPLFIFCGFQHCIANVITMGAARTWHTSLIICVAGNFLGSLIIWYLSREMKTK